MTVGAQFIAAAPPVGPGTGSDPAQKERRIGSIRSLLVRPVSIAVVLAIVYFWIGSRHHDSIEKRYLNAHEIWLEFYQHMQLSIATTVLTVVIAVPLGILMTRSFARWLRPIGMGLGNMGQAIPSIGLIVLLALWFGIGFWTAVAGLVAYSVLPILRNTIVGLEGVDPDIKQAARGMGMSRGRVLMRIELPLAVPVILAGVRTALVLAVATATLATFIAGGGLGDGLVAGIKLNRPSVTFTFGIIAASLALIIDWIAGIFEKVLRPRGL